MSTRRVDAGRTDNQKWILRRSVVRALQVFGIGVGLLFVLAPSAPAAEYAGNSAVDVEAPWGSATVSAESLGLLGNSVALYATITKNGQGPCVYVKYKMKVNQGFDRKGRVGKSVCSVGQSGDRSDTIYLGPYAYGEWVDFSFCGTVNDRCRKAPRISF